MENVNKKQLAENVQSKISELQKAIIDAKLSGLTVELKIPAFENPDTLKVSIFEKTNY